MCNQNCNQGRDCTCAAPLPNVRTATGLIAWYMRLCNFQGWTSYWGVIYIAKGFEQDADLIRHEQTHLAQIKRDGVIKYTVLYLYYQLRYGYKNNRYENEARAVQFGQKLKGTK